MNSIIKTIIASALLFPAAANAQQQGERVLSWEDCVSIALQNNPALSAQKQAVAAAEYKYYATRNALYPAISASHSLSRSGSGNSAANSTSLGLNSSIDLWNPGDYASLKTQRMSLDKATADLRAQMATLRGDLKSSFISMLYAQENIELTKSIYNLREKNANTIELQYASGRESKGNMMYAEAQAYQAKADISAAERSMVTARRNLLKVLGLPSYEVIKASGSLLAPAFTAQGEIEALALKVPAVMQSAASIQVSKAQYDAAGVDMYPSLTSSQSLGWSGSTEFPQYRNWSLGVQLSWPLFSNGITYHKNNVGAARAQYTQAEENYRQQLLTSRADLQAAKATVEGDLDSIKANEHMLEAEKQRHSESQVKYLSGNLSFQDWETVEQSLVSAEKTYLSSKRQALTDLASWEKLLGLTPGE